MPIDPAAEETQLCVWVGRIHVERMACGVADVQGAALVGDKDQRLNVASVLSGDLDDSFILLQLQLLDVARNVANNRSPAGNVIAELKTEGNGKSFFIYSVK